ncbi:transcriptional regulator, AbrB family (plasmid) [Ammonifex degensii KC4]|uniref:Transcriptional regulator, AbrB family n=1 Tax=Ammonifex degensii (strain DSM 10501 / KC4) TaxID=429009 RepID=C9RDG8_AMMDK|nr:AbrB/MazE/SpoVT family DNA-binding domain-containing protein [Ammonifex degensii]ACX53239.1 transcriptional regulator, AbrB family [Ammonifex degensii KC4]
MQTFEPVRVGKRGTVTIPAALRQKYRLGEGSWLVLEPREEGILLRPACVCPVEVYTPERKAEFLLNNAVTPEDYAWAVEEVRKMGLEVNFPYTKQS